VLEVKAMQSKHATSKVVHWSIEYYLPPENDFIVTWIPQVTK
jgi:hypothetical protein